MRAERQTQKDNKKRREMDEWRGEEQGKKGQRNGGDMEHRKKMCGRDSEKEKKNRKVVTMRAACMSCDAMH